VLSLVFYSAGFMLKFGNRFSSCSFQEMVAFKSVIEWGGRNGRDVNESRIVHRSKLLAKPICDTVTYILVKMNEKDEHLII